MATKKYESMKALDEIFAYGYKLRKAGLDYTVVNQLVTGYLVGAPSVTFNVPNEGLSDEQKNTVRILEANGFETEMHPNMILIRNIHFNKLKEDIDKYFNEKEANKEG